MIAVDVGFLLNIDRCDAFLFLCGFGAFPKAFETKRLDTRRRLYALSTLESFDVGCPVLELALPEYFIGDGDGGIDVDGDGDGDGDQDGGGGGG